MNGDLDRLADLLSRRIDALEESLQKQIETIAAAQTLRCTTQTKACEGKFIDIKEALEKLDERTTMTEEAVTEARGAARAAQWIATVTGPLAAVATAIWTKLR